MAHDKRFSHLSFCLNSYIFCLNVFYSICIYMCGSVLVIRIRIHNPVFLLTPPRGRYALECWNPASSKEPTGCTGIEGTGIVLQHFLRIRIKLTNIFFSSTKFTQSSLMGHDSRDKTCIFNFYIYERDSGSASAKIAGLENLVVLVPVHFSHNFSCKFPENWDQSCYCWLCSVARVARSYIREQRWPYF